MRIIVCTTVYIYVHVWCYILYARVHYSFFSFTPNRIRRTVFFLLLLFYNRVCCRRPCYYLFHPFIHIMHIFYQIMCYNNIRLCMLNKSKISPHTRVQHMCNLTATSVGALNANIHTDIGIRYVYYTVCVIRVFHV